MKCSNPLRSELSPRGRPSITEVRALGFLEGTGVLEDGSRPRFSLVEVLLLWCLFFGVVFHKIGQNEGPGGWEALRSISFDETSRMKSV